MSIRTILYQPSIESGNFFIIFLGDEIKKFKLPSYMRHVFLEQFSQLLKVIREISIENKTVWILIGETQWLEFVSWRQQALSAELQDRFPLILVSKRPDKFFEIPDLTPTQCIDVISDKELHRNPYGTLLSFLWRQMSFQTIPSQRSHFNTLAKLNKILISISAERDSKKLLTSILFNAMELTQAGAGQLYLMEDKDGEFTYRVKIYSHGLPKIDLKPMDLKVTDESLCSYVILTEKSLNIKHLSEDPLVGGTQAAQYRSEIDYQGPQVIESILTFPIKNSRNDLVAVLQLVNKSMNKKDHIIPFDENDESLLSSFATQAGICLENADLYSSIQKLFEGFARAAITAIESRDPSTAGHSERVAKLCVALARSTTECSTGVYRSVRFKDEEIRELEYAALLHDFGKIGVREEVLVKSKKLYPYQLKTIHERIKLCKAAVQMLILERQLRHSDSEKNVIQIEIDKKIKMLDAYWQIILAANEPTVLHEERLTVLERIKAEKLILPDGSPLPLITEEEYSALSLTKGSLTQPERIEMQSHVKHTYQFLKMIPWTRDFKHLAEIAYAHHEKLDGSGYPRGITAHEIPLQSKIMTIADIYDALTASDRWYKEALPIEKALDILTQEVSQGKIDPVLFDIFMERKIYELTLPKAPDRKKIS